MKFLLDTQIVLWALFDAPQLDLKTRALLDDAEHQFLFSVVNIWEIAIKSGLKRANFRYDPRVIRRQLHEDGYEELPVLSRHVVEVDVLPLIHKDPFDRILIAQAMVEGITLLTADPVIAKYPGPIRKV
jgi:PIN domain nuclease of toxin-antitoxin system